MTRLSALRCLVATLFVLFSFPAAFAATGNSRPVDIHVFIHDDVRAHMTREDVHDGYVAWWLEDMVKVLPFTEIKVHYHPPVQGLTDVPYMHNRALQDWSNAAAAWADAEDLPPSHLQKFLLVTLLRPEPGVSGIAWQGGSFALAAITGRYRVVAHELGHLMGATHEAGEVRYQGGWWCESNMYATTSSIRSNCYRYTPENERRMRSYAIENPNPDDTWRRGPLVID